MRLHVLTFFRNAAQNGQIAGFMKRFGALYWPPYMEDRSTLTAVYGDSTDGTEKELLQQQKKHGKDIMQLVRYDHGGPFWSSTEEAERMEALSKIVNAGLNALSPRLAADDFVLLVESDLLWDNVRPINQLVAKLRQYSMIDAIAPFVYAGDAFYDIWGFRGKDGVRFNPYPPYHPSLSTGEAIPLDRLVPVEVSSVGSCFVARSKVMKDIRIEDGNALVGFWAAARAKGFHVYVDVDPRQRVHHPHPSYRPRPLSGVALESRRRKEEKAANG
jgi:hypothetical protein